MSSDAEESTVLRLQQRDPDAWAQTYDRYVSDVYSFLGHLVHGNRAVAEEIHQETWLSALASIDTFQPERGDFRPWMFGIARRQVALHYRKQTPRAWTRAASRLPAITADRPSTILPEDVLVCVERNAAVRAALAELGAEARAALLGKYVEGRSTHELAEQLGRSAKAVESLLTRARATLRELLRFYFDSNDPQQKVTK
jgi:RNA polymerase sigma factor (sigma-70 family)